MWLSRCLIKYNILLKLNFNVFQGSWDGWKDYTFLKKIDNGIFIAEKALKPGKYHLGNVQIEKLLRTLEFELPNIN